MREPNSSLSRRGASLLGILIIWLTGVTIASAAGVFNQGAPLSTNTPLPLGLAALAPILLFLVWFSSSVRLREFLLGLDPVVLTTVQTWRVGGVVFLGLMAFGLLPASFAVPAGLGDMAIGVTAPWIARALKQRAISKGAFIAWQVAGIADLVIAVATGVLSALTTLGLTHGVTTRIMGQLPMSLIPTFAVPLLLILHIIQITQARSAGFPAPAMRIRANETIQTRYIG
jgi:hypothetical protein